MSEINVTPMVDVMLVLLVIFMVAAPLLTVGVPVDLPQTQAPAITEPKEPLVITVNAQGKMFLQNNPVEDDALVTRLQAITKSNPSADIYVRGDQAINYGRVMPSDGSGQRRRFQQSLAHHRSSATRLRQSGDERCRHVAGILLRECCTLRWCCCFCLACPICSNAKSRRRRLWSCNW